MPGQDWLKGPYRYAAAVLLVAAAFAIRVSLDPVIGPTRFIYSVFYLAVVLAAYFAGARGAALTALLSAVSAYWAFAAPAFAMKTNVEALVSMGFFLLTSTIDIYFIDGMARALAKYRREHARAEALAAGNARLFQDFSDRTTHHLQLVAALLQLRAGDGVDAAYRSALTEASTRTLAISRAHRALTGGDQVPVAFSDFVRQLFDASLEAAGRGGERFDVSGEADLPAERATSIAMILLEWLRVILHDVDRAGVGSIRLAIESDGPSIELILSAQADALPRMDGVSRRIIDASVKQLQGRSGVHLDDGDMRFTFSAPITPQADEEQVIEVIAPPSTALH